MSDVIVARLNYVHSFPCVILLFDPTMMLLISDCARVTSVRFGIQTFAPPFFDGAKPDFVVSGPNVGTNLGPFIAGSGTV